MKRTYSVYYLTIFVLSLSHQLSNCLSNYTFTSMDDFNKTIPAVCSLTLQCPGARNSGVQCDNNNMQGSSEECTFNASSLLNSTQTFCNGSSTVTVDININVAIVEDNNAFDIISESIPLTCSPILSCNERDEIITWERIFFNGTNDVVNSSVSNGTELMVDARQYGNYTCTITSGNMTEMVTYSLYGGPSFSQNSIMIRVTLHDRVEFTCDPTSVPPVTSFAWLLKDGNILPNQSTFIIEEASYDDEGVYLCVANNPFNNGSKRFELKVRSPLTPLWPALGIIIELSLVAVIIIAYEFHKKHQEEKEAKQHGPALGVEQNDDIVAYNFPSHSHSATHSQRHRVDSITKESLLPDSVQ